MEELEANVKRDVKGTPPPLTEILRGYQTSLSLNNPLIRPYLLGRREAFRGHLPFLPSWFSRKISKNYPLHERKLIFLRYTHFPTEPWLWEGRVTTPWSFTYVPLEACCAFRWFKIIFNWHLRRFLAATDKGASVWWDNTFRLKWWKTICKNWGVAWAFLAGSSQWRGVRITRTYKPCHSHGHERKGVPQPQSLGELWNITMVINHILHLRTCHAGRVPSIS